MIKFIKDLVLGNSSWLTQPFKFDINAKTIEIVEYMHSYLFRHYTHVDLSEFTQEELSSKGEEENG